MFFARCASVVHLGPGEERSEDAVMMNTPVIKSALEMGFERSLVKQTVQSKILTSGENYRTVQELVSDLLSAEDQKREEEREMVAEAMASGESLPGNTAAAQPTSVLVDKPRLSPLRLLLLLLRWLHFCQETPGGADPASEKCGAGVGAPERAERLV